MGEEFGEEGRELDFVVALDGVLVALIIGGGPAGVEGFDGGGFDLGGCGHGCLGLMRG